MSIHVNALMLLILRVVEIGCGSSVSKNGGRTTSASRQTATQRCGSSARAWGPLSIWVDAI